jgi:NTP pyrophosphatase (non-canonical NTP hydrolase)
MEAVEADRKGKRANVDRYNKKIANSRICQWLDPDIPKERGYEVAYNETIKGSIEEELADAVIRLLDLAGLRGIDLNLAMKDLNNNIDDMSEACKDETFTESIYAISTLPVRYDGLYDFPTTVNDMIMSVFGLACHLDIDLFWHIEQKMQYNELREKMHGKKY